MYTVKKRGISDVVTTVLIIMLVLAAVAILAGFVLPFFRDSTSNIGGQAECLQMDVRAISCTYDATTRDATVTIEHFAGGATLSDVRALVDATDGTRTVSLSTLFIESDLELYEADSKLVPIDDTKTPKEVSVGIQITVDSETFDCAPSTPVSCSVA